MDRTINTATPPAIPSRSKCFIHLHLLRGGDTRPSWPANNNNNTRPGWEMYQPHGTAPNPHRDASSPASSTPPPPLANGAGLDAVPCLAGHCRQTAHILHRNMPPALRPGYLLLRILRPSFRQTIDGISGSVHRVGRARVGSWKARRVACMGYYCCTTSLGRYPPRFYTVLFPFRPSPPSPSLSGHWSIKQVSIHAACMHCRLADRQEDGAPVTAPGV